MRMLRHIIILLLSLSLSLAPVLSLVGHASLQAGSSAYPKTGSHFSGLIAPSAPVPSHGLTGVSDVDFISGISFSPADLVDGLSRASLNAGLETAILGGSFDDALIQNLQTFAASTIGEVVAFEIGELGRSGDLSDASRYIAHAALGCASATISSGSESCGGGAVGAVAGEVAAEVYVADWLEDQVADGGAAFLNLSPAEQQDQIDQLRVVGADVGKLAGALAAFVTAQDVNAGARAGSNAARNNALCAGVCITVAAVTAVLLTALEVADKALLAKDAAVVAHQAYVCQQQGSPAACEKAIDLAKQAATDAGIELTVGTVVPGSKVGADLLRWLKKHGPEGVVDDVIRHADEANTGGRTFPKWKWGGKNVSQAEVDEAYTVIANSKTDVEAISRYLNLNDRSRGRLEQIKDYLFRGNNDIPNFQADPAIATAWHRLRTGQGTASDKLLLKHEVAEIWIKKNNPGISHTEAHRRANSRANWEDTIPWLDFD